MFGWVKGNKKYLAPPQKEQAKDKPDLIKIVLGLEASWSRDIDEFYEAHCPKFAEFEEDPKDGQPLFLHDIWQQYGKLVETKMTEALKLLNCTFKEFDKYLQERLTSSLAGSGESFDADISCFIDRFSLVEDFVSFGRFMQGFYKNLMQSSYLRVYWDADNVPIAAGHIDDVLHNLKELYKARGVWAQGVDYELVVVCNDATKQRIRQDCLKKFFNYGVKLQVVCNDKEAADKAIENNILFDLKTIGSKLLAVGIITKDRGFHSALKLAFKSKVKSFVVVPTGLPIRDPLRDNTDFVVHGSEAKKVLGIKDTGDDFPGGSGRSSPGTPPRVDDGKLPGSPVTVTPGCSPGNGRVPEAPGSSTVLPGGKYIGTCISWQKEDGGLGTVRIEFDIKWRRIHPPVEVTFRGDSVHSSLKSNPGTKRSRVALPRPKPVKLEWRKAKTSGEWRAFNVRDAFLR